MAVAAALSLQVVVVEADSIDADAAQWLSLKRAGNTHKGVTAARSAICLVTLPRVAWKPGLLTPAD